MSRSPDLPRNRTLLDTIGEMRAPRKKHDTGWIYAEPVAPAIAPSDRQANDPLSPQFENGWGNAGTSFAPFSFYLSPDGEVRFRGHIVGGVPGTRVVLLPEGYRPEYKQTFIVPNDAAGYSVFEVDPDGSFILVRTTAT